MGSQLELVNDRYVGDTGHEVLLELAGTIVLLGEAGGSKTRLTKWLGHAEAYTPKLVICRSSRSRCSLSQIQHC